MSEHLGSRRVSNVPLIAGLDNDVPTIAPSAWVAPHASIIGKVRLGEHSSIWYNSVVRADDETISIGTRSNIQDVCVLHADPGFPVDIGDRVSVGHGAVIHGAKIGDDALIGMGARVLNGADIGKNSLVAAGALVLEGFQAPEGSLIVGTPARIAREVRAEEMQLIRETSDEYARNARRHMEQLSGDM